MNRIIVFIFLLFIFGCRSKQSDGLNYPLSLQRESVIDSTLNYQVAIDRPTFNSLNAVLLNASVKMFLDSTKKAFIEECEVGDINIPNTLEISLIDSFYDASTVSYCFAMDRYYSGAAHDVLSYHTFNYDLNAKKELAVSQIIHVPDSTLVRLLSKPLLDITENCIFPEDLDSTILNSARINLNRDSVVFSFDHYSISSYGCGAPRVRLPKTILGYNIK